MAKLEYYGRKAVRYDDEIFVCAGDVETEGLGGKLLSVQWGYMGQVTYCADDDMVDKFFDAFLDMPKPAVWFFHFGQYDWRYFLDYINEQELEVEVGLRTETDLYEIRCRRPGSKEWSVLRDSYALWSQPLEKLAQTFCPEIPKLEIDIANFDPRNPEHIAYAKRDVQILLLGLPRLFDMISDTFNVVAGATSAGTALKAWQKSLSKDQIYDCQKYGPEEEFIRQGYYGGLVFLTSNRAHENCKTFDLNSSYPASMLEYGVPTGRAQYTTDFEADYPGIYRVRVKAPSGLIIPILPARNERGAMRWYSGEFETVVTTQELQFAALQGYEILDLFEGYFWEKIEFPFTDFINMCRFLRKHFPGLPQEAIAKLMQNSLYGKFGTRRDRVGLVHHSNMNEDEFIGATPFDEHGIWYVKSELDESMRCLPHWAAFITANSRLRLLRAAYAIGPESVLYGDTDSLTVRADADLTGLDIGTEYGQWKPEKDWDVFRAVAPKVYSGILVGGKYTGAAKGMPRKGVKEQQWRELLESGQSSAETLSLASLKVAMKQGIKPATLLTRKSSTLNNSMNFQVAQDGAVRVKSANG